MTSPSSPTPLRVASILGYAWGALMLLLTLAVAIPTVAQGRSGASLAVPAALSVASAMGAYGVGLRRWPYVALGASTAWIAFLVMVRLKVSLVGIAVNVVILGLVLTNLRRFEWRRP